MKLQPKLLCVQINLTNLCPCKCECCEKFSWPRIHLEWKVLSKLLHELDPNETTVILSGGEPSVYPKIDETLQLLNKLKFKWGIFTTGIGWRKESLNELAKATWIRASIFSNIPSIVKTFIERDALFIQHDFIIEMQNKGANISGECTVTKTNENFLPTSEAWGGISMLYYPAHEEGKKISGPLVGDRNESYLIPYFHVLVDSSGALYPDCVISADNDPFEDGKELRKRFCLGNLYKDSINKIFYSENADILRSSLLHFYQQNFELKQKTQRYSTKNRLIYDFLNTQLFL